MKRSLPLFFAFIVGLIVILSEFIPHTPFNQIISTLENWFMIISGFAIVLGQISLIRVNTHKIANKTENWQYSIVTMISFTVMLILGLLWGMRDAAGIYGNGEGISFLLGEKPFDYLFDFAYQPLCYNVFSSCILYRLSGI